MNKADFKALLTKISKASEEISESIEKISDALDDPLNYDILDYLLEDIYSLVPSSEVRPYVTVDKLVEEYGELFDDEST